jgi:hypothetical protein
MRAAPLPGVGGGIAPGVSIAAGSKSAVDRSRFASLLLPMTSKKGGRASAQEQTQVDPRVKLLFS